MANIDSGYLKMYSLRVVFCILVAVSSREIGTTCEPNEEYIERKPTCPPQTCQSVYSFYDCRNDPPPKPGCACKNGFLRLNDSSPCISVCDCPVVGNFFDKCQQKSKESSFNNI